MKSLLTLTCLALALTVPPVLAQGPPPIERPVEMPVDKPVETPQKDTVTVWVVVAKGPGCNAGALTRKALDGFADKVERRVMSGSQATLILKAGQTLDRAELKKALEAQKLTFESLTQVERARAKAAYVIEVPGLACAHSAAKAREALTVALGKAALAVHADKATVIELARDEALDVKAVEAALAGLGLKHGAPKRDDYSRL